MTSVPFDFHVTTQPDNGGKPETFGTVDFRFGTKQARALERAAGFGIDWIVARGQSVEALVLVVCYGLQQTHPKMTEQKACDLIDAFIANGGDVAKLSEAAFKALRESGVYGKREPEDDEKGDTEAPPLAPTVTH